MIKKPPQTPRAHQKEEGGIIPIQGQLFSQELGL